MEWDEILSSALNQKKCGNVIFLFHLAIIFPLQQFFIVNTSI